jgi:hypothetical protein
MNLKHVAVNHVRADLLTVYAIFPVVILSFFLNLTNRRQDIGPKFPATEKMGRPAGRTPYPFG